MKLTPIWILTLGWALFAIMAYPGLMAPPSFYELASARSHTWDGSFIALWTICDAIVAGPFLIVALASAGFVVGGYLVARDHVAPRAAALCAIGALLVPSVAAGLAVASAPAVACGALAFAAGLVRNQRKWLAASLVLLFAATLGYGALIGGLVIIGCARQPVAARAIVAAGCIVASLALAPSASGTATIGERLGWGESAGVIERADQPPDRMVAAEIQIAHGAAQAAVDRVVGMVARTPLVAPTLYLVLAGLLMWLASPIARTLLASGGAQTLWYVGFGGAANYREALWLVGGVTVVAAVLVAARWSSPPPERS